MMCEKAGEITAQTRSKSLQLGANFRAYSKIRTYHSRVPVLLISHSRVPVLLILHSGVPVLSISHSGVPVLSISHSGVPV
jgi:hypothetical protein